MKYCVSLTEAIYNVAQNAAIACIPRIIYRSPLKYLNFRHCLSIIAKYITMVPRESFSKLHDLEDPFIYLSLRIITIVILIPSP